MKKELTLMKIGKETGNKNKILTFADIETVDLGFATKKKQISYCIAVSADAEILTEVGDTQIIDFSMFEVITRENEVVDEETGELVTLKSNWLHFKA